MGESKRCVLAILAASIALAYLKQEMTWIVHASGESAYHNMSFFCFLLLAMFKKNLDWTFQTFSQVILFEFQ